MAGPFYNCIKGTTAGTPGTGAFTPNAASAGFLAWSTVPTGWIGLVRYEDGTDWELQYSYWNGTTLSRSATKQFVASSTGSGLTLTSAATAAMVADANEIGAPIPVRGWLANSGASSTTAIGTGVATVAGTAAAGTLATTNYFTRQTRTQNTSATTANAQAGWSSSVAHVTQSASAGIGGWLFNCKFGVSAVPTGPRLFIGMCNVTFAGNTGEPSANVDSLAVLGLDSTDTNMQFLTNNGTGSGTKIDTGIPLAVNGWYEVSIWTEPGSLTVYMLLVRLDTGAIYYGSTATDVPLATNTMRMHALGGLNGTNTGTAIVLHLGHATYRDVA